MVPYVRFVCLSVIFAICCNKLCSASGLGRCPKYETMTEFNTTRFIGQWYELERSFYLMELTSNCISIDLKEKQKGQIGVSVKMKNRWSGSIKVSEGIASPTKKGPGSFSYKISSKLPNILNRYLPGTGFYQVLKTDYENYAIIWTCSSFGVAYTDLFWIWGREQELNATLRAEIYNFLTTKHIDSERLVLPKNYNCSD